MTSPIVTSPTGKKLVKTKFGLRMINIIDDECSPFEIDEPQWKPDSEVCIVVLHLFKFEFVIFNVKGLTRTWDVLPMTLTWCHYREGLPI